MAHILINLRNINIYMNIIFQERLLFRFSETILKIYN